MTELTNPSDHQLNAAFAEHICGWKEVRPLKVYGEKHPFFGNNPEHPPHAIPRIQVPDFANCMDLVMPWLEKHQWWAGQRPAQPVHVTICDKPDARDHFHGVEITFSRAAVIALLRESDVKVIFTDQMNGKTSIPIPPPPLMPPSKPVITYEGLDTSFSFPTISKLFHRKKFKKKL